MDATGTTDLRAIVRRVGGELFSGGNAALVPGPGHSPKDRSLSLRLTPEGRVLWWSHAGDEARDVWKHLGLDAAQDRGPQRESEAQRRARLAAERAERERKLTFCREVWAGTQPAEGSPVERYLRGRGVAGPIPKALRFHPAAALRYPDPTQPAAPTFAAMVAICTAEDGKSAAGLHVTALRPDGAAKADLRNPRRMFGELSGAVVQLSPVPTGGELAVAEGIETALAYRQLTGTPCWAALSTSGLRRFTPPPGLARLVVAADNDDPQGHGIEAARVCAERASRRCDAAVIPAPEGQDWADVLKEAGQ